MRKASAALVPVLVIILSVAAFSMAAYFAWPTLTKKTATVNTNVVVSVNNNSNVATNTNTTVAVNTNTVANTNATITTNTNTTVDPTKGWKTYTNTPLGYTIKYPTDYSATTDHQVASIEKGQLNGSPYYRVEVVVYSAPILGGSAGQDIYTWAKNGFPVDINIEKYHANPRRLNLGTNMFMYTDGDLGSTPIPEYLLFHNNKLYVITDFRTVDKTVTTNQTIISTFVFTDPTADWKTYTNATLGYSLNYPSTCTQSQKMDQGDTIVLWTCNNKVFDFDVRYRTNSSDVKNSEWFETGPVGQDSKISLGNKAGNLFMNYHCGEEGCASEDTGYIVSHQTGLLGLEFTHHQALFDESKPYVLGADEKAVIASFTFTK